MYDITSKSADDFINHEEILDTIKYADENKNNIKLMRRWINEKIDHNNIFIYFGDK